MTDMTYPELKKFVAEQENDFIIHIEFAQDDPALPGGAEEKNEAAT